MSKRSEQTLLADILDAITQVEVYTAGLDENAFSKDRKTQDAVVRNLEIIGEASSRLPDDFRSQHSDIPWALMRGLRNRIVHVYFGVDLQLVWEVIVDDLPPLKARIQELVASL
jgi:uncharacterized protein with HEPN domain